MKNHDDTPCDAITAIYNAKSNGENQLKSLVKECLDEE